jgi:hypothetical protein
MLENRLDDKGRPTPEFLRELLKCDPETGKLFWLPRGAHLFADGERSAESTCRRWNSRHAGKAAFTSVDAAGYHQGIILYSHYRAHRVIWAMVHDEWPRDQIDHINGVRADNRIGNLRSVTNRENSKNRKLPTNTTSGRIGVTWSGRDSKWRAVIDVDGGTKHLGYFDNFEDASDARKAAEFKYGYHENHGRD